MCFHLRCRSCVGADEKEQARLLTVVRQARYTKATSYNDLERKKILFNYKYQLGQVQKNGKMDKPDILLKKDEDGKSDAGE